MGFEDWLNTELEYNEKILHDLEENGKMRYAVAYFLGKVDTLRKIKGVWNGFD